MYYTLKATTDFLDGTVGIVYASEDLASWNDAISIPPATRNLAQQQVDYFIETYNVNYTDMMLLAPSSNDSLVNLAATADFLNVILPRMGTGFWQEVCMAKLRLLLARRHELKRGHFCPLNGPHLNFQTHTRHNCCCHSLLPCPVPSGVCQQLERDVPLHNR